MRPIRLETYDGPVVIESLDEIGPYIGVLCETITQQLSARDARQMQQAKITGADGFGDVILEFRGSPTHLGVGFNVEADAFRDLWTVLDRE